MDKKLQGKLEDALYVLAELYREAAADACTRQDTNAVHWFVTEERKAGNMPRTLKLRFGQGN